VNSGPGSVDVRDVRGRTEADATSLLEDDGFVVTVRQQADDDVAAGRVVGTDPPAGSSRPRGSTITLIVSSGPEAKNATVPGVVGLSEANATSVLENAGFVVDVQEQEVISPTDDGRVVSQSPNAGASRPEGSTVTITVGRLISPDDDGGE
jgi:beta-lactam-binding protein with PASTA domain